MRFALREREFMALVLAGELEVDSEGRIWQLTQRKGTGHKGGLRTKAIDRRRAESQMPNRGYLHLQKWINHRCITCYAHRLVWQALRGDIQDGFEVNHINGVKSDNRPENLELVQRRENIAHARRTGLMRPLLGERCRTSRLTRDKVIEIRRRYAAGRVRQSDLATEFGVCQTAISAVVRGRSWAHVPQEAQG